MLKYLNRLLTYFCFFIFLRCNAIPSSILSFPTSSEYLLRKLDAANLQKIFEKYFEQIKAPGMIVSITQGGQTLFTHGYGYSDIENNVTADPAFSLYEIGSISKLFTVIAVLQLWEKGIIHSLEDDVNKYLDHNFKIPPFDNTMKSLTIRHLLTHTSGFEEQIYSIISSTPMATDDTFAAIKLGFPHRVASPGEYFSYSNHGMHLAGHLVAILSGKTFPEYVAENIFRPLEMNSSTFSSKMEDPVRKNAVDANNSLHFTQPYQLKSNGTFRKSKRNYVLVQPAGSMITTASDMAKFLQELSQMDSDTLVLHSPSKKSILLQPQKSRAFLNLQYSESTLLPGVCFGIFESYLRFHSSKRIRFLNHGGNVIGFDSMLYYIPEYKIGMFISRNANMKEVTYKKSIIEPLFSEYLDSESQEYPGDCDWKQNVNLQPSFIGVYTSTRNSFTTYESLTSMGSQTVVKRHPKRPTLLVQFPASVGCFLDNPSPELIVNNKDVLQVIDPKAAQLGVCKLIPNYYITFKHDKGGVFTYLSTTIFDMPFTSVRIPWHEYYVYQLIWYGFAVLTHLLHVIYLSGKFVGFWGRRNYQKKAEDANFTIVQKDRMGVFSSSMKIISLLHVVFIAVIIALGWYFAVYQDSPFDFLYYIPTLFFIPLSTFGFQVAICILYLYDRKLHDGNSKLLALKNGVVLVSSFMISSFYYYWKLFVK